MKTRFLVWLALFVSPLSGVGYGRGQGVLTAIELDPPSERWYHDAFPALEARVEPALHIEHSRLYFRCSLYSEYSFVDLESSPLGFRGIGPMAEEACPRVHDYVEMPSVDFTATRTEERIADVTTHPECRRRFPAAALFSGDPKIVIGSTISGAERMAPGCKLAGVKGFLSAATGQVVSASASGVIPAAAFAGIGAAGVAVAVSASSPDEVLSVSGDGESSAPAGGTTPATATATPTAAPAPPSTPQTPQSVRACFTLDPPEAVIDPGDAVRLDGRCSTGESLEFSWNLGDGRKRDGAFITPIDSAPGTFTVTLSVTDSGSPSFFLTDDRTSRTIRAREPPPTLVPCFIGIPINLGANCDMKFDAACSAGDIVAFDWILDQGNVMGAGPYPESGAVVIHDWTGYPGCVSFASWPQISVLLTVAARDGSKASLAQTDRSAATEGEPVLARRELERHFVHEPSQR